MDDAQSDLFTDIHIVDRWRAIAGVPDQSSRSATDEAGAEVFSSRLFDDIYALPNPSANAAIPEVSAGSIAVEGVPDLVTPSDEARPVTLDGPTGTGSVLPAPVAVPPKGQRGLIPRCGARMRLRIAPKFRGPSRAIISSAPRASPKKWRPLQRGPPS